MLCKYTKGNFTIGFFFFYINRIICVLTLRGKNVLISRVRSLGFYFIFVCIQVFVNLNQNTRTILFIDIPSIINVGRDNLSSDLFLFTFVIFLGFRKNTITSLQLLFSKSI